MSESVKIGIVYTIIGVKIINKMFDRDGLQTCLFGSYLNQNDALDKLSELQKENNNEYNLYIQSNDLFRRQKQ